MNAYWPSLYDAAEAKFPDLMRPDTQPETWWWPIGYMKPCPMCGTLVILARDSRGERRFLQLPRTIAPEVTIIGMVYHSDQVCADAIVEHTAVNLDALLAESAR